jgi:hypothetical protein
MYFQVTVAALVCLTATCVSFTAAYLPMPILQLRAKSIGFKADEEIVSWIGTGRDLFYLHTQVN